MKIVVVFPTSTEAQFFKHPSAVTEICGVGLSASAYNTAKIIAYHKPDWLIMAGIGGAYEHSAFTIGDVMLVESECEADLGFFTPAGFTHLADLSIDMDFTAVKQWLCPYIPAENILPVAKSNSMNAAMAPFISTAGIDIENMEGAAFFQVCLAENQPFLQVRSVSNMVKISDDEWSFVDAIRRLTEGVYEVINYLLTKKANGQTINGK